MLQKDASIITKSQAVRVYNNKAFKAKCGYFTLLHLLLYPRKIFCGMKFAGISVLEVHVENFILLTIIHDLNILAIVTIACF